MTFEGVSIIYSFQKENYSPMSIGNIREILCSMDFYGPPTINLAEKTEEWKKNVREKTYKSGFDSIVGYNIEIEGFKSPFALIYMDNLKSNNSPRLKYDITEEILSFYATKQEIPIKYIKLTTRFLDIMLSLLKETQPSYGWGDDWKEILKQEGRDPRQFIWGVNYWNKELSELVGRDKIKELNGEKWKVQEHPETGGISLSGLPNPYRVKQKDKDAVAEVLQIKEKLKSVLKPDAMVKKLTVPRNYWESGK